SSNPAAPTIVSKIKRTGLGRFFCLDRLDDIIQPIWIVRPIYFREAVVDISTLSMADTSRHPDHPDLQWTGRGRKTKWPESWLDNDGSLEELALD
ncbi:MAG TPA: hypothetical protein VJ576_19545, partial [Rhodocyclaceae bacterium]|nr:hypothetical protein [Rhodocyclaceae bacterium]